uniref:Uncharacterized protein n=1 Tax=Arundo donax TaxID=35708 RepID=A0A0A9BRC0_ARUDO
MDHRHVSCFVSSGQSGRCNLIVAYVVPFSRSFMFFFLFQCQVYLQIG